MTLSMNTFLKGFLFMVLSFSSGLVFASEIKCGICSMKISEQSRNHIILKSEISGKEPLHVCSLSCVHKARKYDAKYTKSEVSDFNHPEKFLPGEKAFFLVQSKKIKTDLGAMAMVPYFGAFDKKEEADSAQKKYGDGIVVQGIENALEKK